MSGGAIVRTPIRATVRLVSVCAKQVGPLIQSVVGCRSSESSRWFSPV